MGLVSVVRWGMDVTPECLTYDANPYVKSTVSVVLFFIDGTAVTNTAYVEYRDDLQKMLKGKCT
jgi:hypothetical protein